MSTGSAVGLSSDVRLLRTLKTVLPALNLKLIAPPSPVPSADAASHAEIRVVLIDADYPDVAAILKWLEPQRRIPVILMRDDERTLARNFRGAAAVLSKPVDPKKLRAAVELVVPDWEEPIGPEPRLAEILDLFGTQRQAAAVGIPAAREEPPAGPKTEDEIDRILGSALAEIGLPAGVHVPPPPAPWSLPRPAYGPPPPAPGPRKAPSAADAPEGFPAAPDFEPPPASQPVDRPLRSEPASLGSEPLFASFGPAVKRAKLRTRRLILSAGLAVVVLGVGVYLGFGRKTPSPAVAAPAGFPAVEQAALRTDAPVTRAARPDPAPVQKAVEEPNPAETKTEPVTTPPAAAPRQKPAEKVGMESKPSAPIEAPAILPAKVEAEANPAAGVKDAPPGLPSAKDDPAPKAKAEEPPAAAKPAVESPARPEPVKSGDLIDLADADIPPALLHSVEPVYPPVAYQNKQQAKVSLTVLISERGEILEAKPGPDSSVDLGFVKAALRAVRRWSYSPAFKNGVAVRVWKTLIIDFRIK